MLLTALEFDKLLVSLFINIFESFPELEIQEQS